MRRERLTTLLGIGAKGLGAAIQVMLWPIIARALGDDDFHLLVVVWAATNWLTQIALGLPMGISHTFATLPKGIGGPQKIINASFGIFLIFLVVSNAVVVSALSILSFSGTWLFAGADSGVTIGIFACAIFCQLNGSLVILSGVRLGMGSIFKYYFWLLLSHFMLICAVLMLLIAEVNRSEYYLMAIAGIPALSLFLHMLQCGWETRPSLREAPPRQVIASIFDRSMAPSAVHLANIGKISLPVTVAASLVDIAALAAYSVCIRLAQQIVAMPVMVCLPHLTPLAASAASGDISALRTRSGKILLYASIYAILLGGVFAVVGPDLVSIWLSNSVEASKLLCMFVAILMIGWTIGGCLQPSMLALGHGRVVSLLAGFEALSAILVGLPLLLLGGEEWLAAALALPLTLISMPITIYFVFFRSVEGPVASHG